MNVSLTPELERLVTAKVKSGMYGSSSEVIRAALRLLQQWEANQSAQLQALRRDVGLAIEQAERGQLVNGDDAFDEILKRRSTKHAPDRPNKSRVHRSRKAAS